MSEPLVEATPASFLLDGELPRLGSAPAPVAAAAPTAASPFAPPSASPVPPPAPGSGSDLTSPLRPTGPSPMLSAPGSTPVLGSPSLPAVPAVPAVAPAATPAAPAVSLLTDLPSLPTLDPVAPPAAPTSNESSVAEASGTSSVTEHPMAHLMPQRTAPSESSRRAAEIRAAKKAKARKIKIGVAVGALAVAAIIGPPLARWFVDALNDAGKTSTEVEG